MFSLFFRLKSKAIIRMLTRGERRAKVKDDVAGRDCYLAAKVAKVIADGVRTFAVSTLGVFGFERGLAGVLKCLTNCSIAIVLAAAPVSWTFTTPSKMQFLNAKFPPPYVSVGLTKRALSQTRPSSCCEEPPVPTSEFAISKEPRGTTGTKETFPIWAKAADCTKIDVWMPPTRRRVASAPTKNDPNAIVTLRITPHRQRLLRIARICTGTARPRQKNRCPRETSKGGPKSERPHPRESGP
jgi:hypothetical protein